MKISGKKTITITVKCKHCNGDRKCKNCGGLGVVYREVPIGNFVRVAA